MTKFTLTAPTCTRKEVAARATVIHCSGPSRRQRKGVAVIGSTSGASSSTQKGVSGTRKRGPHAKPPHHIHHRLYRPISAALNAAMRMATLRWRRTKGTNAMRLAMNSGVCQKRPRYGLKTSPQKPAKNGLVKPSPLSK